MYDLFRPPVRRNIKKIKTDETKTYPKIVLNELFFVSSFKSINSTLSISGVRIEVFNGIFSSEVTSSTKVVSDSKSDLRHWS